MARNDNQASLGNVVIMGWLWPVLLLVLFVLVWNVIRIVLESHQRKNRHEALRKAALKIGFVFSPADNALLSDLRSSFFADAGSGRGVTAILMGRFSNHHAIILDYEWGMVDDGHFTVKQTFACFRLPNALPTFIMRPRGLLEKFGFSKGSGGLTRKELSKSYLVESAELDVLQVLFQGEIADFFASQKGWVVKAAKGWLIVNKAGRTVMPRELPAFLSEAGKIFTLFAHSRPPR